MLSKYRPPTPSVAPSDPPAHGGRLSIEKRNETARRAQEIVLENTPPNTRRARESALRSFWAWADVAHGGLDEHYPVEAELLVDFIVGHSRGLEDEVETALVDAGVKKPGTHSVATIEARVSHLSSAHRIQGLPSPADDPTVRELMKRLRRERARQGGQRRHRAIDRPTLDRMLATCDGESLTDIRDAAILLVGCAAGGRRRSEIAAADVDDLESLPGGSYLWKIGYGKTDQEGEGLVVPIKGRAAAALCRWLDAAGVESGAVFRSLTRWGHVGDRLADRTIYDLVRRRAKAAGLDEDDFGAHSMRAGFMTQGGRDGIPLQELMPMSGHRSLQVARRYHRPGELLNSPAADVFG